MLWDKLKNQGHIVLNGETISLSHLADKEYSYTIEKTAKHPEQVLNVLVQYSSHCISLAPKRDEKIDFSGNNSERKIFDGRVYRCFCDNRYELSKFLPDIFTDLLNKKCIFTGKENFMMVEIITKDFKRLDYEIFFSVSQYKERSSLKIYVESAYVRDGNYIDSRPKPKNRKDKIKAKVLLAKKARGEPIRRPGS